MKISVKSKRRNVVRNLRRIDIHTKADLEDFTGKDWRAKSSGKSKQVGRVHRYEKRVDRHRVNDSLRAVQRGVLDTDQLSLG